MDWLSDDDIKDAIHIFEEELSVDTIREFLQFLGSYGEVLSIDEQNPISYALVYCETDYIYSSEELEWIKAILALYEVTLDNNRIILVLELNCPVDDYYIYCSAIIKLYKHVKWKECLYIFKHEKGIIFGSYRNKRLEMPNNFAVSRLIPFQQSIEEKDMEFLDEIQSASWEEIPQTIINYSPNEENNIPIRYDRHRNDFSYVESLLRIADTYGVSTNKQIEDYNDSFVESEKEETGQITYKEACELLKNVGKDIGSSYDVLDAAENAARTTEITESVYQQSNDDDLSEEAKKVLNEYSDEALENAELLLKEIMGKNH